MSIGSYLKLLFIPADPHTEFIKAPIQGDPTDAGSSPPYTEINLSQEQDDNYHLVQEFQFEDPSHPLHNQQQTSPIDRMIQKAAVQAGSITMFALMWLALFIWIIYGFITNFSDKWQIFIQDGQSIQTYVWDTLLMRQQLDDSMMFLRLFGLLKSRSHGCHLRLIGLISEVDRQTRQQQETQSSTDEAVNPFADPNADINLIDSVLALVQQWAR
ncbi:unnamed protein product [Ambrosiozyma monospora]|uniref:Unnamed protein product n=1 Tax=Ambrosiozyma monospora TaxID=43982 RepID=A0ACB5TQ04_AMBMO|nr:unnamed protein product [Ambrosiozyma monospora]